MCLCTQHSMRVGKTGYARPPKLVTQDPPQGPIIVCTFCDTQNIVQYTGFALPMFITNSNAPPPPEPPPQVPLLRPVQTILAPHRQSPRRRAPTSSHPTTTHQHFPYPLPPPEPPPTHTTPLPAQRPPETMPRTPSPPTHPTEQPYSHLQGHFGHILTEFKAPQHLRIQLQNPRCFPLHKKDTKTEHLLHNMGKVFRPDITLMMDIGLNWQFLPAEDQWHERCYLYGMTKQAARFQHNTTESKLYTKHVQWGGTGIVAMHDALPRAPTFGCDESKLGRWTWVRLQARENRWLRIIAA